MDNVDNFNEKTISCGLHTKWAGNTVHFAEKTDSTNLWIKRLAKEGEPHGTVAAAELQTAGRGRLGRSWSAPSGSSVMMSLLLRPQFSPQAASMLTLLTGLSVAQACEALKLPVQIKWPNDVVLGNRKICGILTEMSADQETIDHVVIGVGINVNIREFPGELKDTATSLYLETGVVYDRGQVACLTLEAFEKNYDRFCSTLDLSLIQEEYNGLLVNMGRPVKILDPQGTYEAVSGGIDEKGRLQVTCADGTQRKISSGEVSVRGLYGYV